MLTGVCCAGDKIVRERRRAQVGFELEKTTSVCFAVYWSCNAVSTKSKFL